MSGGRRPVRAKICGVKSARDAAVVAAAGADYMGMILSPGYGRSVEPECAAGFLPGAPLRRVGVFVDEPAERVAAVAGGVGVQVIQLSGGESPDLVAEVAAAGPWQVWKTVHIRPGRPIARLVAPYAAVAGGILLDAWNPALPGGTGTGFRWTDVGEEVRAAIGSTTFIAAGGMNPGNAAAALRSLEPDVLDVSSGVESSPGRKDPGRTRAFVATVRRANARAVQAAQGE